MIAADNLCFAYGDQLVLDRLTFVLPDGGRLLLRGPNGSGKTTLLRLVMGLIEPNSGRLTGIDRPIAAVFQDDRLAGQLTAIANLRLVAPRSMPRRRAEDELAAIGLDRGVWSKAVCQLSGGQRRRVAIARAMLQASLADDAIVVLDEPFSGVAQVGQAVDPVAGLDQGAGPASGLGSAADTAPGQDTAGSTAQYAQGDRPTQPAKTDRSGWGLPLVWDYVIDRIAGHDTLFVSHQVDEQRAFDGLTLDL